jgi:hypothetical protein
MGSASLKYSPDGRVAWNEIWGSFCDLAMAGGPPHRGALLQPGTRDDIESNPARYAQVVEEICRGVSIVTDLTVEPSEDPGWVRVFCSSVSMAQWLVRAVVMENISASCAGIVLNLPAGPHFRIEKEIKNVVTSIAKTCHYWVEHTSQTQQQAIANLFEEMELAAGLLQPAVPQNDLSALAHRELSASIADSIFRSTGIRSSSHNYFGWLGLDFLEVPRAIRIMRLLVVSNVLSRREGTVVFVPVNPSADPGGERVLQTLIMLAE